MDLIIARYNERLDWLGPFCERKLVDRVFIYNKGTDIIIPPQCNIPILVENRPNEGRDVEAYVHHIAKYYNNFGDHMLFLQANPYDHIKHMENKLLAFKMYPSMRSKLFVFGDHVAYDTGANNPR